MTTRKCLDSLLYEQNNEMYPYLEDIGVVTFNVRIEGHNRHDTDNNNKCLTRPTIQQTLAPGNYYNLYDTIRRTTRHYVYISTAAPSPLYPTTNLTSSVVPTTGPGKYRNSTTRHPDLKINKNILTTYATEKKFGTKSHKDKTILNKRNNNGTKLKFLINNKNQVSV